MNLVVFHSLCPCETCNSNAALQIIVNRINHDAFSGLHPDRNNRRYFHPLPKVAYSTNPPLSVEISKERIGRRDAAGVTQKMGSDYSFPFPLLLHCCHRSLYTLSSSSAHPSHLHPASASSFPVSRFSSFSHQRCYSGFSR